MNAYLPSSVADFWSTAGWTMVHFLWLGALIGAIAAGCRLLLRRASANLRYAAMLACLFALVALPIGIATWLIQNPPPLKGGAGGGTAIVVPVGPAASPIIELHTPEPTGLSADAEQSAQLALPTTPAMPQIENTTTIPSTEPFPNPSLQGRGISFAALANYIPYLPWLWLIGTPITFVLLLTGLVGTRRLSRASRAIKEGPVADALARLAASLKITRRVAVAVCERIAAPVLIGVVRPMILLPPAAITGWSPDEIEMVLLHELAHVRRWDNLINLLQRSIESLLFFHPAVWLVSTWVRRDRETCCDALVVHRTNRPHAYAEMLVALAAQMPRSVLFHPVASSAMAAGPLRSRIRRILQLEEDPMLVSGKSLTIMLGTLVVTAMLAVLYVPKIGHAGESTDKAAKNVDEKKTDETTASFAEASPSDDVKNVKALFVLGPANRVEERLYFVSPQLKGGLSAEFEGLRSDPHGPQVKFAAKWNNIDRTIVIRAPQAAHEQLFRPRIKELTAQYEKTEAGQAELRAQTERQTKAVQQAWERWGLRVEPATEADQAATHAYARVKLVGIGDAEFPAGTPAPMIIEKQGNSRLQDFDDLWNQLSMRIGWPATFQVFTPEGPLKVEVKWDSGARAKLVGIKRKETSKTDSVASSSSAEIATGPSAPAAPNASRAIQLSLVLKTGPDGNARLFVDGKPIAIDDLKDVLPTDKTVVKELLKISLSADNGVSYSHVMRVIDALEAAGATNVAFDTRHTNVETPAPDAKNAVADQPPIHSPEDATQLIDAAAWAKLGLIVGPASEAEQKAAGVAGSLKLLGIGRDPLPARYKRPLILLSIDDEEVRDWDTLHEAVEKFAFMPSATVRCTFATSDGNDSVQFTPGSGGSTAYVVVANSRADDWLLKANIATAEDLAIARRAWLELGLKFAPLTEDEIKLIKTDGKRGGLKLIDFDGMPQMEEPFIVTEMQTRNLSSGITEFRHLAKTLDSIAALKDGDTVILNGVAKTGVFTYTMRKPSLARAPVPSSKFPSLEDQKLADFALKRLGLELESINSEELKRVQALGYTGGVKVVAFNGSQNMQGSMAANDILVGLHVWPTTSLKDVETVLQRDDIADLSPLKYYVVHQELVADPNDPKLSGFPHQGTQKDFVLTGRISVSIDNESRYRKRPKNPPSTSNTPSLDQAPSSNPAADEGVGPYDMAKQRDAAQPFATQATSRNQSQNRESGPVRPSAAPYQPSATNPFAGVPIASTPSTVPANPARASAEEIEILHDRVKSLEEQFKQIEVLYKQGRRGGELPKYKTTACALAIAQGELELAQGQFGAAIENHQEAVKYADEALKAVLAEYNSGRVTHDSVLQAIENLSNVKLKLLALQKSIAPTAPSPTPGLPASTYIAPTAAAPAEPAVPASPLTPSLPPNSPTLPTNSPIPATYTPGQTSTKQSLRYDGKTFEQWRGIWQTELSTEKRSEAVKALAAFGCAGYAQEAAEAILDVAAEYDFYIIDSEPEGKLKETIIAELAPESRPHTLAAYWLPDLASRLKKDPKKWTWLTQWVVSRVRVADEGSREILQSLATSEDPMLRNAALGAVIRSYQMQTDPQPDNATRKLIDAELADKDANVVSSMLAALVYSPTSPGGEVSPTRKLLYRPPMLTKLLTSEDANVRLRARGLLPYVSDEDAGQIVDEMIGVLRDDKRAKDHVAAIRALAVLGPKAAKATSTLVAVAKNGKDDEVFVSAIYALVRAADQPALIQHGYPARFNLEAYNDIVKPKLPEAEQLAIAKKLAGPDGGQVQINIGRLTEEDSKLLPVPVSNGGFGGGGGGFF